VTAVTAFTLCSGDAEAAKAVTAVTALQTGAAFATFRGMLPPSVVRLEKFPTFLKLARGRSSKQRAGALIHSEREASVTVTLRVPDDSPLTFGGGQTEVSTTESFASGEHREVLLDWRLIDKTGARPEHVLFELDVQYDDDAPGTVSAGVMLEYSPVSLTMILAGVTAVAVGAAIIATRRRRVGETRAEFETSRSEPRTDARDWSAGQRSDRDRSTLTYR
jgi:hypothetical protein